jgi:hypothetical protein
MYIQIYWIQGDVVTDLGGRLNMHGSDQFGFSGVYSGIKLQVLKTI